MSEFGLNTKVDPNRGLQYLPGDKFLKIRNQLDTNPSDKDWRALARIVDGKYSVKAGQIERWSPAINGQRSAAECVLNKFSSDNMTVGELIKYLDKLRIDPHKLGLVDYAPITISQDIESVELCEGETLNFQLEAEGYPYPQYQWFFCKDGHDEFTPLQGRTENFLKIDKLTSADRGTYCCMIYNSKCHNETRYSEKAVVTVVPNPNPREQPGLHSPNEQSLEEMLSRIGPHTTAYFDPSVLTSRSTSIISRQPQSLTVGMNQSFVLSVETNADPPIRIQWYRNNEQLQGEVWPKLQVEHAMPEDFGEYYCVVKDGNRTEHSHRATVKEKILRLSADIVVIAHPKSVIVEYGGNVLFSCEAICPEPLAYQWFRDGCVLKGETKTELKFTNIQDRSYEGLYQCEISLRKGSDTATRRLTDHACLQVKVPPGPQVNIRYNPSDKVALLIGNYDYRNEEALSAPIYDVAQLSEIFRSLNFKVVALLNLTKKEIENIVNYYCELITENVYVVFYFCGHGFENFGNTFLVPTDARAGYTSNECVCTEWILDQIQNKNPALIFMIIDICRKGNHVPGQPLEKQVKWKNGNIVYFYATSLGLNAFEDRKHGLLVDHMAPLLTKSLPLDNLMSELKADFCRVSNKKAKQIPHLSSNLQTPRRLTDEISYKSQTEANQRRENLWRASQVTPQRMNIQFPKSKVVVELDFQADFSNVLKIFCTVIHPVNAVNIQAIIRRYPPTVSMMGNVKPLLLPNNTIKFCNCLQDIQKLQGDLEVGVQIKYHHVVNSQRVFGTELVIVNLRQPLVAPLKLWRNVDNPQPSRRQATEFDETDS